MRQPSARIMFIEDEPVIRDAVATALTGAGYSLRRKLEACGPRIIHSARGHGYRIRA